VGPVVRQLQGAVICVEVVETSTVTGSVAIVGLRYMYYDEMYLPSRAI